MNELQTMLAESAADLFDTEVTPELLAAVDRGEWPERLWRIIDEAGYPQLFAEPDAGLADAYPLVEAAGHALLPVPLPDMLVATWLLRQAGLAIPSGIIVPGGTLLRGVPWAHVAGHIVSVTGSGDAATVRLFATKDVRIERDVNAAGEPRDNVYVEGTREVASAPLPHAPGMIVGLGALLRATQMAGALRRVLALTTHYAGERTQFGRPIGQFQAISQQIAVLAEESTAATIAAAFAWERAASDPGTGAIAVAKIRTGMAAASGAEIAHAVFGAIGITAEHSLHFATRRLWSWRAEYGAERAWASALGSEIVRAGGAGLWSAVVGM